MKQPKIILGLILCLALFLRLVFLGSIPAGFSPDEASQAYSAYSLLHTGNDEWSVSWPLSSFKSFLDYKAPLQTYLMIPSIALFGLNEFAARLPSALFGILAVLAIYLLVNELFPLALRTNHPSPATPHQSLRTNHLALLSAFFLAISPWHLQFSRTALEVNLASFLFPIGLYFFLRFIRDLRTPTTSHQSPRTNNFALLAVLSWSFCLYTYHAAKVFLPLFALVMVFQNWGLLVREKKSLILPLLLGLIITFPLIFGTVWGQAGKRGGDLFISSLSGEQRSGIDKETFYSKLNKVSRQLPRFFHNPTVFSISKFAENYVSYFTPSFWFTEGGREITYSVIPGRGLLYFWMLPLIVWALFDLFRDKKNHQYLLILLPWLLLAALPAALTKEGYRPNRAGSFALLWEMLAAYGAIGIYQLNFKIKKIITTAFVGLSLVLTIFYFEDYAFGSTVNYPTAISYGWREAIGYISQVENNYSNILIQQGSQPQAFVAFYTKVNPLEFQAASRDWDKQIAKEGGVNYLDQLGQYRLGKYSFETLNWPEDRNDHTLYLSKPSALLPVDRRILHRVEIPDGVVFEIFDFKK